MKRFALPILFLSLVANPLCHSQDPLSASAILESVRFQVPGGRGFTLWINRANHFIERVVTDSSTRYWSDYRRVEGVMLPFSQRSGSGAQEILFTVTKYALLKTVEDADFAIPFQKDYEMPASGSVTVPAEDGITFRAKVNGKGPYRLIFDTGSVNLVSASIPAMKWPLRWNPASSLNTT